MGWRVLWPYVLALAIAGGAAALAADAPWLWLLPALTTALMLVLNRQLERDVRQPIGRLAETMRRLAEGDQQARMLAARDDDIGRLIAAFNALNDARRLQATILTDRSELLGAVFAQMRDGVIITDAGGTVTSLNRVAQAMFETTAEQAIGRSVAELVRHHQIIELWQQARSAAQEQSAVVDMGWRKLFLQVSISPLHTERMQGFLLLLYDLTPVRRLETVRRDFISNISHELRTPLAALRAVIETLQDGALDDPVAAARFLEKAEREVDALTHMVEELLELSRIESGQVPFRFAEVDLAQLVEGSVERMRPSAERRELTLTFTKPVDLPPVTADAPRIEQVVANLLFNAVKFTPAGGRIEVTLGLTRDRRELLVCVRDTGIGIPAEHLPRIFERFFKGDRARSSQGVGLGLAIAKHTVQAHGGRIWVESKEHKGSAFSFTLPVAGARSA